jgi:hypothetical protein
MLILAGVVGRKLHASPGRVLRDTAPEGAHEGVHQGHRRRTFLYVEMSEGVFGREQFFFMGRG